LKGAENTDMQIDFLRFSPEGTAYRSPGRSEARAEPWVTRPKTLESRRGGIEDRGRVPSFSYAAPLGLIQKGATQTLGSARASLHPGLRYAAPTELIQSRIAIACRYPGPSRSRSSI